MKYKAMEMNIGFGKKEYSIMGHDGEKWVSARPVKYYKTLAGANRAISKMTKFKL